MVSSVTSNVTAASASSSTATLKDPSSNGPPKPSLHNNAQPTTKITIRGFLPSPTDHDHPESDKTPNHTHHHHPPKRESTFLTLHPQTPSLASEWLDGLLMLLNQHPITNETSKLIALIQDYGLKIRLLNVRFEELGWAEGMEPEIPGREGLEGEEFWYDIFGGN